jgi:uncharacterized protein YjbJ (UPF0337 family)
MTTVKDKLNGSAKEIAAEIFGDSKLAEEGARQKRKSDAPDEPKDETPSDAVADLNNLT